MSSILKALQKLEDEHPRKTGGSVSWPRTPGVKKTLRRWEITSGRFAPVLWAALTVVVLAAAGWFFIYMRSPADLPAPSAQLPDSPLPTAAVQPQTIEPVGKPPPATRATTSSHLARKPLRRARPASKKAGSSPAATARRTKGGQQRKPVPPPAAPAQEQTGAELPVLPSGLELQAVSWDPSPANRIAVINGSIMREGASIEGYSVVRIKADEVHVRKGLSEWRLVFNLKK